MSYVNAYQKEHDGPPCGNMSTFPQISQCLFEEPVNKIAIEGMGVMQGFNLGLPSLRLTWLPTLLSAQFLNSRNPNMSPFPGETSKFLDDRGIALDPFGHGVDVNLSLPK